MNFYWVYSLPNWLFGILTDGAFVAIGVVGLYLTRGWARRLHIVEHSHNDIVGYYLAAVTVFYGITLGLLAVGTWNTYDEVQGKIDHSASVLGAIYRDVSAYPEPVRSLMQREVRSYTREVIDQEWPLQRKGVVPNGGSGILNELRENITSFEPTTERQKIVVSEAYHAYNEVIEARRARLDSVTQEMPGPLWTLVIVGALFCIALTWCFHTGSFSMHLWMTVIFSALLGLMIYLIAVLDNPYRGKLCVSPEPLERVYQQTMAPDE
jgi:hypothetical protein